MHLQAEPTAQSPNPLTVAALGGPERTQAERDGSAPCWSRTNDLLIKSQLLCQLS